MLTTACLARRCTIYVFGMYTRTRAMYSYSVTLFSVMCNPHGPIFTYTSPFKLIPNVVKHGETFHSLPPPVR